MTGDTASTVPPESDAPAVSRTTTPIMPAAELESRLVIERALAEQRRSRAPEGGSGDA